MFLISAGHPPTNLETVRRRLEAIGESVLVAGDARTMKIHVHNERPDEVIAVGLSLGTLSRISIENLDQQAQAVREARAGAFTGASLSTLAPVAPVEPLAGWRVSGDGQHAARSAGGPLSVVAGASGDRV